MTNSEWIDVFKPAIIPLFVWRWQMHWLLGTVGNGSMFPVAHPPESKLLEAADPWPQPPSLPCLLSKMTGKISLEKRTWQKSKLPSGHVWTCWVSGTSGISVLGRQGRSLRHRNCSSPWRTNCETFKAGLQLLNEPKWALAGRRIAHTSARALAGQPELCWDYSSRHCRQGEREGSLGDCRALAYPELLENPTKRWPCPEQHERGLNLTLRETQVFP